MKPKDIFKAIGEIDEDVIANAKKNQKSHKKILLTIGTVAACAVFGCAGAVMLNMPKNNIAEPNTSSAGNANSDTAFDGNYYSAAGESKIITGDYSVIGQSDTENSSQRFEISSAEESSETVLEQMPIEMYTIKDGELVHSQLVLDANPQTVFTVWKSENYIGEEVQLVNVKTEDNGTDTVSEYSGAEVVTHQKGNYTIYTLTITSNLEDYYEIEDFGSYRSKELVLESLEKTMTSMCDSKPDEYHLVLVDEVPTEESESNHINPQDIQYNEYGEILE